MCSEMVSSLKESVVGDTLQPNNKMTLSNYTYVYVIVNSSLGCYFPSKFRTVRCLCHTKIEASSVKFLISFHSFK